MPTKIPPKVQSAVSFVAAGIQSGRYRPGELLPSIRRLAAEARVSFVTMWKAINLLRKQGRLSGKPGEMPRVAGRPLRQGPIISEYAWSAPVAVGTEARNRLAARIRKDILNGRYPPGAPLPLLKQLETQYRTSTRSLQRVLTGLCSEGVLEACGRGYAVPRFSSGKTGAAIGFVAFEEYLEHYNMGIPQGHDYLKDAQLYASQAGVRLIVEPYHRSEESTSYIDPSSPLFSTDQGPNILGYIHILSEALGFEPLLKRFIAQNKPLAILEQNGYWQFPDWLRRYPVLAIPVGITANCGEAMGRFLLSLGHKRIAYFSPYHPGPWSVNRFKGLSIAFEQAGLADAVQSHTIDFNTWFADQQFKGDKSMVPKLKLQWPAKLESPVLRRETRAMEEVFRAKVDSHIVVRNMMQGLFEDALNDEQITAWVGGNDEIAVLALEFLRQHGVKVPQDISIASFDDSFRANANGLTSYNFNMPAIMNAAMQHVLQSHSTPSTRRGKIVHIDGMVVERQSTGPARRG